MGPGHRCFAKAPQVMVGFHLVQLHLARDVLIHMPLIPFFPSNPLSDPCGTISDIPGNICLHITQVYSALFFFCRRTIPKSSSVPFAVHVCKGSLVKPFHFSLTFHRLPETSSLFQWLREHLRVPDLLPRGNCDSLSLLPWI